MSEEVSKEEIEAVDQALVSMGFQEPMFTISIGDGSEFPELDPNDTIIIEIESLPPKEWKTKGKYDNG